MTEEHLPLLILLRTLVLQEDDLPGVVPADLPVRVLDHAVLVVPSKELQAPLLNPLHLTVTVIGITLNRIKKH